MYVLGWTWNWGAGCACLWQEKFPKLREITRFQVPRYTRWIGKEPEAGAPWLPALVKAPSVLWDSVSPWVGAGFGSRDAARSQSRESVAGRALEGWRSPHLFTGSGPETLGHSRARPEGLRKPDTLSVPLTQVVFWDLLEPSE